MLQFYKKYDNIDTLAIIDVPSPIFDWKGFETHGP